MDPAGLNVFTKQDFLTTWNLKVKKLLASMMTRVLIPGDIHNIYQKISLDLTAAKVSNFHFS